MECFTMSEISIGQTAVFVRTITENDLLVFCGWSGDLNPIHVDKAFAAQSRFGQRIAPGFLASCMIGHVLGEQLPGADSVYVSQTLNFKAPVFVDDVITCTLTVQEKNVERNRLTLSTVLTKADGTVVIEGTAVTLPSKAHR